MSLSAAQLGALVTIKVREVRMPWAAAEYVIWDSQKRLRTTTVAALLKTGLVEVCRVEDRFDQVVVTTAGDDILHGHQQAVETERIRFAVESEHQPRYQMYTRGHHPVRGWGRGPMGCRVSCSCGLDQRVNEGRKAAEEYFGWHIINVIEERLIAAGLPALDLD